MSSNGNVLKCPKCGLPMIIIFDFDNYPSKITICPGWCKGRYSFNECKYHSEIQSKSLNECIHCKKIK